MISLRLSEELETRLAELASATGRTKTFYVREAIESHIEDLEDVYLAEASYEGFQKGNDELISHEEFWDGLDG